MCCNLLLRQMSESERTFTVLQHRSLWGAGNESDPLSAVPRVGRVKGSAAQLHCGSN